MKNTKIQYKSRERVLGYLTNPYGTEPHTHIEFEEVYKM